MFRNNTKGQRKHTCVAIAAASSGFAALVSTVSLLSVRAGADEGATLVAEPVPETARCCIPHRGCG